MWVRLVFILGGLSLSATDISNLYKVLLAINSFESFY